MRKYEPIIKSDWDGYGNYEKSFCAHMIESSTGEWVKLSTFNDTVASLNAQIERLKKQLAVKCNEVKIEPDIKIGDKLRIIDTKLFGGKWGHCFKAGDIVTVESIEPVVCDEVNDYEFEYNVVIDTGCYKPIRQVINKDDFEKVVE